MAREWRNHGFPPMIAQIKDMFASCFKWPCLLQTLLDQILSQSSVIGWAYLLIYFCRLGGSRANWVDLVIKLMVRNNTAFYYG